MKMRLCPGINMLQKKCYSVPLDQANLSGSESCTYTAPSKRTQKTIEYKTNGIKRDKNERLGNSNIYVISNKRSDLTLIQGAKLSFVCLALELSWPHASNSLMDNSGVSLICKMLLFLHPMFSSPTEKFFMLVGLKQF